MRRLRHPRLLRAALAGLTGLALLSGAAAAVTPPPTGSVRIASSDGTVHWASEPPAATLAAYGADSARQASAHAEQFYFALPDRLANGNPGNDTGGLAGDRMSSGYDPTDKGFYHGGDLQGVIDKLDYIQGLGTTAIWLAPVFKNRPVQGTGANASAGYHGYWITDFTQVDPHFGTNDDLKRLVRLAHQRHLKIFLDVIVNHTADVIQNTQNQYSYVNKATTPYKDVNGQPFEDANYADGRRGFPAVNAASFPYTPAFASPADAHVKAPAWLNDPTMYHNRGDSTFSGENATYGDFAGLDDLWTERPEVIRGMTTIYQDWISRTGIDGYRVDTVKNVDLPFWPQFSNGIQNYAAAHDKPDFFTFGEVYSSDPEVDATYVRQGQLPATLDFPFQAAASGYVARGGSAADLANVYAADPLYTRAGGNANTLPTFLGNHDMGRIGYFITSGGQSPDTYLQRDILGHQLMFLTRGQPVVYSGDEQGFAGTGGDKDARQDMFASRTAQYRADAQLGTTRTDATDEYDPSHPIYQAIAQLAALRQANPGLRDGAQITRYAATGPGVFAFSRLDAAQQVEYLVAVNNATTAQTVTVPTNSAGMAFDELYPQAGATTLTTGADTATSVTVPALSAVVYKARAPLAKPAAAPSVTISSPTAGARVATRAEVTAQVPGNGLNTVTVAVRVGGGDWRLLGTATHAPYTVYHDLIGLAGGTTLTYKAVVRDASGQTATTSTQASVGTPPLAADHDYVVVHYQRPAGDYSTWGLYTWGDIDPSAQTQWPAGQPFAGQDAYGRFAWVKLKPGAANVGFLVVDSNGVKDVSVDRTVDPTQRGEIWLEQGDPTIYGSVTEATGSPAPAPDPHTAVLHYRRADGNYAGWGLHVWTGAANPTSWGGPILPSSVDSYGAVFRVPLVDGATSLSYIVHNGDTKDLPSDQSLDLTGIGHQVWLLAGQANYLLPLTGGAPAPDTNLSKSSAQWIDRDTVAWKHSPTDGRTYQLAFDPSGKLSIVNGDVSLNGATPGPANLIGLSAQAHGLTEAQRSAFPNLWQYTAFAVSPADRGRIKDALRGQVIMTERDATGKLLGATGVQLPGVLDDVYRRATSARLGPVVDDGRTTLSVWAPTAQQVSLELSATPGATATVLPMRRDDSTGVWSVTGGRNWKNQYYRYRVTAWQPATNAIVTASVTDPYSLSVSTDSTYSQIVDLADPALAPTGWSGLRKPGLSPGQRQIQELSVRDFSIADPSVPAAHRGTYLAFTDQNSAGMTHLRDVATAGLTDIHLMPVFDFASVPERRADQAAPPCDLASLPPNSDAQQACIAKVATTDGYNWGYDPYHYTTPEGSYATDPQGTPRITQFRQMVQGLNSAGLRVIMDVVYNHTPAAGTAQFSVLDQIVPGYYQRLLDDGTVANSTCCANTAPEHAMMGKLVVDSVVTWARYYKVDGFRFDLMGHHPKANILAVRAALNRLTLAHDGVDGKKIYLYGEGWNFGEVANNARFIQASQANLAGTGIGTFNDRLRDAVRGGGPFDSNPRVQGFASGLFTDPNGDQVNGSAAQQRAQLLHEQDLIQVGLTGNLAGYSFTDSSGRHVTGAQVDYNGSPAGYTGSPGEAITYVDAHDNQILYDALAYKLPQATSPADRARMQVLALSTTLLGQGVGFSAAGSDRLRSKSLDANSYNSGDWFNEMLWGCPSTGGGTAGGGTAGGGTAGNGTAGNGFGKGLPPAADNGATWPFARPLLADPALVPDCGTVATAQQGYDSLLRIRRSSPLFALGSADAVQQRLTFPVSGTSATPGVITMLLTDQPGHRRDPRWKSITVIFNASTATVTQTVSSLRGASVGLHPVQANGSDPVVGQAHFDPASATFTVPARTVAVFVQS